MLAYQNTLKTKSEAVAFAQWHQDQDKFIQGTYWDKKKGRGCSVGCMTHEYCAANNNENWHQATEDLYGIPRALSRLQDRIFEGLPKDKANLWTVRFMDAVPEGKDLSMVIHKFLYWILTDEDGIRKHARPDGLKAIVRVSELLAEHISGKKVKIEDWREARDAAAAAYAADAAAYAAAAAADAAAYAADAAAYAADAAAYAADAAAYAAAAAAYAAAAAAADAAADAYAAAAAYAAAYARKKYYERMSDKLIEIIQEG